MPTAAQFVDISSNNPVPDVRAYAAAGHKHLCRKVTEGTGYHWFQGDSIADACHAVGLHVGHYHWLRPDSNPLAQAAFFIAAVRGSLKPGDWLMSDFERTGDAADPGDSARAAQLRTFNQAVTTALPNYPLYVYTGNWYLAGNPAMQAEARRWPIVMSDYSGTPVLPNPYGLRYVAWQFTDRARVPGLSAPVDYNRWLVQPETSQEFHMTPAEAAQIQKMIDARADQTDKLLAAVLEKFIGTDGHSHTVESTVAHVTKRLPYKSRKGRTYR